MKEAETVTVAFSNPVSGGIDRRLREKLDGKTIQRGEKYQADIGLLEFIILETSPDGTVTVTSETQFEVSDLLMEKAEIELQDCSNEVSVADELELIKHSLNPRTSAVSGVVINMGAETRSRVSVEVTFYEDEDATYHLDTRSDSTNGLKPEKKWRFKVRSPPNTEPQSYDIQVD